MYQPRNAQENPLWAKNRLGWSDSLMVGLSGHDSPRCCKTFLMVSKKVEVILERNAGKQAMVKTETPSAVSPPPSGTPKIAIFPWLGPAQYVRLASDIVEAGKDNFDSLWRDFKKKYASAAVDS